MSVPSPAMLKGLKKPAEKPASATTPQEETSKRRSTSKTSSPTKHNTPSKKTRKPGRKPSSVKVEVIPSDTSTTPSQKPNTPPSSGASASMVRSRRKAKSSKTQSKDSTTSSDPKSSKSGKRERSLGYRNQPLRNHEGLKALQKEMEKADPGVITGGRLRSVSLGKDGMGRIDFIQSNHVPPHQDYTRDQLIRKIEQGLMKGTN